MHLQLADGEAGVVLEADRLDVGLVETRSVDAAGNIRGAAIVLAALPMAFGLSLAPRHLAGSVMSAGAVGTALLLGGVGGAFGAAAGALYGAATAMQPIEIRSWGRFSISETKPGRMNSTPAIRPPRRGSARRRRCCRPTSPGPTAAARPRRPAGHVSRRRVVSAVLRWRQHDRLRQPRRAARVG